MWTSRKRTTIYILAMFLLFSGLMLPGVARAATYWVSPTGAAAWSACSGSTALSGAAACSLAIANANAVAGDTVYIRSGTFTLSGYTPGIGPTNNGTSSSNMIVFWGYPSDPTQPVFSGGAYGFFLSGNTYISI